MKNLLNFENELIENRNREFNGKKWEGRGWESKNIFFLVWLKYFLLKFFENNHKCVPFGLLITNINLLLLLIYFFYYWPFLDLFWISSPFIWYTKYQLCYLKRCLCTQTFYLFIVTSFFYYYLFFFCVCWKLYITD
jgi:hypothetical protein